jgi:signal recognition particle GTPase
MARSWSELLGEADAAPEPEGAREGLFSRLRDSLGKSRRALTEQLVAAAFDPDDSEAWERLEEALIAADVQADTRKIFSTAAFSSVLTVPIIVTPSARAHWQATRPTPPAAA